MNIIFFLIFIAIFRKNKKDRKRSDLFRGILGCYIAITIASMFISSPVFWLAAIAMIVFVAARGRKDKNNEAAKYEADYEAMKKKWEEQQKAQQKDQQKDQSRNTGEGRQRTLWDDDGIGAGGYGGGQASYGQYNSGYTASKILPRPINRRNRIVRAFNEKYRLSLTEEEVRRIVEASYVSEAWKREVEAMTVKYDTEGQWFAGPTDWLRVYIYVFEIQNISSDFSLQEQICFETLDEVMAYGCAIPDATIDERIRRINDRYFTCFDEMTFMIAYRFLQRKGRNYDLSRPDLIKNVDQELEETMKKYQKATGVY